MEALFQNVEQVAFVVKDLDAAIRVLTDDLGIGPVIRVDFGHSVSSGKSDQAAEIGQVYLDGQYTDTYAIRLGCVDFQKGLQIELIEPLSGPSIFQMYLDRHGPGAQHIAVDCPGGFEAAIGRMGAAGNPLGQIARVDNQEDCAFIRHHGTLGTDLELHRRGPDFHFPDIMPPMVQADRRMHPTPLADAVTGVSFACRNLERQVTLLRDRYGIGPWSEPEAENGVYRTVCTALNLSLELEAPVQAGGALDRWLQTNRGPGIHHLTLHCPCRLEETAAFLQASGYSVTYKRDRRRFVLADFTDSLGVFLKFTDEEER